MNWISLTHEKQLNEIKELSKFKPQVIFKHSTRCSISDMVKSRLERSKQPENTNFYCLDLIKYRPLSDKIAEDFNIQHESPQVLLIRNKECVYAESHNSIQMDELIEQID